MFTINHDEAQEIGGRVAEGEYEVLLFKAFEDAAKSGTMFINMHLIIRNDIDQAHKNQYLFGSIWQSKETGEYHSGMINTVAKALQVPNGKKFNTLEDLLNEFQNKTARVTVEHEEYNGKINARVKRWEKSKFQGCNHQFKKIEDNPINGFTQVSNDDIPF
ncbi:DUF669 domain-containing protein [Tissierella creatinophila]|uniref:DUF669 domain-containing protein n=1 Tax=Tissierella creatinophila DSM 6911 TaxID=1123403 RepID=A0A1U7M6I7_TISCR|nr:DUF669 domain-containing protein [Tissierella creatinophila]OLS02901.1 hypothetical protein TICRE_10550 [Tissierella creatinophila DSM 6911]